MTQRKPQAGKAHRKGISKVGKTIHKLTGWQSHLLYAFLEKHCPTGKVDRKILPAVAGLATTAVGCPVLPHTVSHALRQIRRGKKEAAPPAPKKPAAPFPPPGADSPLLIDIGRLSHLLARSRASIKRDVDAGRLPAPLKLGASNRWRLHEVMDWVVNQQSQKSGAADKVITDDRRNLLGTTRKFI